MQYDLRLVISYVFDRPTGAGRQHLRIQPAEMTGLQSLLSTEIAITPDPSERREFTDFFGTKVLEVVTVDKLIYSQGQIVSGHTLKHLAAGVSAYLVLFMLQHRRSLPEQARAAESSVGVAPGS